MKKKKIKTKAFPVHMTQSVMILPEDCEVKETITRVEGGWNYSLSIKSFGITRPVTKPNDNNTP